MTIEQIKDNVMRGNKRAIARWITLLENKNSSAFALLRTLYHKTGKAHIIGVTGPPGAGKSTLTDKIVKALLQKGHTIAIIAVDPTSPYTGGAILGDRIRMNDLATHPDVFIRSMGARGHLGGISEATSAAIKALDVAGYDYIFVETVGVGQSEIDIVRNCDTTLMITVPGLGDDIQAIKAGVFEIGDVFAVNKADRDGADRAARELEAMLDFNSFEGWKPPVLKITALKAEGIDTLIEALTDHRVYMDQHGQYETRRIKNAKLEVLDLLKERVQAGILDKSNNEARLEQYAKQIVSRTIDPFTVVDNLYENRRHYESHES